MDAGRLDADREFGGDLPIRVAAGEQPEYFAFARRETEGVVLVAERGLIREVEVGPLREQFELLISGCAPSLLATWCASRAGTAASAREAPAATSASACRQWQ